MRRLRRFSFEVLIALALASGVTALGVGQAPRRGTGAATSRVVRPSRSSPIYRGLRSEPVPPVSSLSPGDADAMVVSRFVPDEVIVKFRGDQSDPMPLRRATLAVGARGVTRPVRGDFALLQLPPGSDPEAAAAELAAQVDVEYAQPNYLRQPLFVPNDPFFHLQWNLMQIGMERAWDVNRGSAESVTVAVIDSGAAFENTSIEFMADEFTLNGLDYPALGRLMVPFAAADDLSDPSRFVAPFDFVWEDDHPVDMNGHGTHVAGTLGQLTNNGIGVAGVAFNVRLMPLKVLADEWDFIFGAAPACCGGADADVAAAIHHAVEAGADVINMSLGGPDPSPVIDDAIRFAVGRDVFVAIAGGNSFENGNPTIWPAATASEIDGAVSVGAVDRQSRRARYSNTGAYIEIVAPGGDQTTDGFDGIVQQTLDPDFALTFLRRPSGFAAPRFDVLAFVFFQGTSMAAPHVAGLAALLKAQGVTSPAAIESALKVTATDLGASGDDEEYGAGLVDAARLVRGLGLAR